jgi:Domain of unknown function (DUF4123)
MSATETIVATLSPEKLKKSLEALLFAEVVLPDDELVPFKTYAILDGAAAPGLLDQLYAEGKRPEFVCLYRGELEPDIAEVAPYLVRLEPGTPFTDWLLMEGWGKSFGVYVRSVAAMDVLRRHFRRFLRVKDPQGKTLYFRFYDPRVLRNFLPTCNLEELETLFGPLSCYLCEGDSPDSLLELTKRNAQLMARKVSLLQTSFKP